MFTKVPPPTKTLAFISAVFLVQAFGPKACRILHQSWALRCSRNDVGSKCEVICCQRALLFPAIFILSQFGGQLLLLLLLHPFIAEREKLELIWSLEWLNVWTQVKWKRKRQLFYPEVNSIFWIIFLICFPFTSFKIVFNPTGLGLKI